MPSAIKLSQKDAMQSLAIKGQILMNLQGFRANAANPKKAELTETEAGDTPTSPRGVSLLPR